MSRYFEAMRVALERHGGTVEKFIGDAVMAVFGLPVRHEDDALRAVRAAAAMQAALPALNDEFRRDLGHRARTTTSASTPARSSPATPASGQRLVTGDAVNTAARLEQAPPARARSILGELTYRLARDQIEVEPIAPLDPQGQGRAGPRLPPRGGPRAAGRWSRRDGRDHAVRRARRRRWTASS